MATDYGARKPETPIRPWENDREGRDSCRKNRRPDTAPGSSANDAVVVREAVIRYCNRSRRSLRLRCPGRAFPRPRWGDPLSGLDRRRSPRIPQTGGQPVDREVDTAAHAIVGVAGAMAFQQLELQVVQRVEIGG